MARKKKEQQQAIDTTEPVIEGFEVSKEKISEYCDLLSASGKMPKEEQDALYAEVKEELSRLQSSEKVLEKNYKRVRASRVELDTHFREVHTNKRNWIYRWIPANVEVEYEEKQKHHFMQGINIYKLIYICFLGSFLGVVLEMFYALISEGIVYSRAGLVYGPFNFLYGIGAVALSLALYPVRHQRGFVAFLSGMLVGSGVEYFCSWLQETLFGSVSWDYSDQFLNINGRICLFYSLIWGILGYLWIKVLYPVIAHVFVKIPSLAGKILAWLMVAFLCFNGIVTSLALFRWDARNKGEPPSNAFWQFIDDRFPDERLEKIFVKIQFEENQ